MVVSTGFNHTWNNLEILVSLGLSWNGSMTDFGLLQLLMSLIKDKFDWRYVIMIYIDDSQRMASYMAEQLQVSYLLICHMYRCHSQLLLIQPISSFGEYATHLFFTSSSQPLGLLHVNKYCAKLPAQHITSSHSQVLVEGQTISLPASPTHPPTPTACTGYMTASITKHPNLQ